MLIHPIQSSDRYPIGSIIEAYAPPNDDWLLCNGQILAQIDYLNLFNMMADPHPIFEQWESRDTGMEYTGIQQVVYGNSLWVGCCYDGYMVYSSDGDTWTQVSLATYGDDFTGIAYDGTTFVSVPDYSTPITRYVTSTDGTSWTERNDFPAGIEGHAICYDGTNFYCVSYDDGVCLYSSNGTSWSSGAAMPDTTFYGCAASPDVLVATSYSSGVLAVSTDAMTTWKFYSCPISGPQEIYYDSTDDIFVMASNTDPVYAVSPGDDGVNWDVRHLSVVKYGNRRMNNWVNTSVYRIKKAGNYWFALGGYSNQMLFSSDLNIWNAFNCMYGEWYDAIYNSLTGYYYVYGYGDHSMRWKEVTEYNIATHFKLPKSNDLYDYHSMSGKRKYIRVK